MTIRSMIIGELNRGRAPRSIVLVLVLALAGLAAPHARAQQPVVREAGKDAGTEAARDTGAAASEPTFLR